jgi:hypothetical protein
MIASIVISKLIPGKNIFPDEHKIGVKGKLYSFKICVYHFILKNSVA